MAKAFNIDFNNTKLASKLRSVSENKKDIFIVLFIYIAGVLFYFFLGNYQKTIAIYSDEMLYYDLARSIFQGKGLIVRGLDWGFTKIGYTLLITPFFAIKNIGLRITMITLFNCMLMMCSVFIAYNIAKEINMKRGAMYLFLVILALWPSMLISETFMSEVLYFPLILLFVMLWIKEQKAPEKLLYPVLEGVICFLGYMTKEVFLSVFVTYFLIKIMYPFAAAFARDKEENGSFGKAVRSGYSLKQLRNAVIFGAVFAVLYIISRVVFSGADFYGSALSRELSLYNIIYLFYGIGVYLSGAVIATLIFPFVYPLIMFKKTDEITRKLICFVYCALAVTVAVISYTILINEDAGNKLMRLHFRYLSPYLVLIMLIFLASVFDKEKLSDHYKTHSHTAWLVTLFAVIFSFTFFTGIADGSHAEQHELGWFKMLQDVIGETAPRGEREMTFRTYSILFALVFLVLAAVGLLLIKRKKYRQFYVGFTLIWLLSSAVNLAYGHELTYSNTSTKDAYGRNYYADIQNVSDFIDSAPEDGHILYVLSRWGVMRRYVDTYIDRTDNSYYVLTEFVSELSENGTVQINTVKLVEAASKREYGTAERIDYIVCDAGFGSIFSNVELIPEASGTDITVYRNLDNTTLNFEGEAS